MANNAKGIRRGCLWLIVILIGLVVLLVAAWLFLAPLANDYLPHFFAKQDMDALVVVCCVQYYNKSQDECITWMKDMMAQHRDEIMTCAEPDIPVCDCLDSLDLKP